MATKTITGIKVGQTTITASYTDELGSTVTSSGVLFTVGKAPGYINTTPAATTNIVYGSGSSLISNATAVANNASGTMMYRVGTTGNYSSSVPTTAGLSAGTYTLYFYAAESTSYNQSATGNISITIGKATVNPTFSNSSVSATLAPTAATTSPAVNCGTFTVASAGHGGGITYSIISVNGSSTIGNWSMTSNTSRVITVPASTAGGTYTIGVRATEAGDSNYNTTYKDATITVTVNKKTQTAPTASGNSSTYATSGSISGSASGGGGVGTLYYRSDAAGGTSYGTATTAAPSRARSSVGTTTFIAYWGGNDYWAQSNNSNQASIVIDKATAPATFSNQSLSVTLAPTAATTSPAVNCGAFTAATAGHSGSITYSIVSVNGGAVGSWSMTSNTSRIITVPASTVAGTYTIVVRATESGNGNYYQTTTDATITLTVNKKAQTAPTASGNSSTYATSGSISGSASGGGGIGTLYYRSDTAGGTNYGTATTTAPSRARSSVGTTSFIAYYSGNDYWAQSNNSNQAKLIIDKATVNPTFNNSSVSANLNPTNYTTSPAVNCGAFTAATAGHGGDITYSIVSVNGGAVGSWSMTSNTSRIITVPASTAGGTYTIVVKASETGDGNYYATEKTATITVTVNKKSQTAPTATGNTSTYSTSGSISGSASGGGCTGGSLVYKSDAAGGTNYGSATSTAPSRSRSSVGTTTFIAYWEGNDYWAQSNNSSQASLVINRANPTYTAPTAKTGLKYNGSAQTIYNAGSNTTPGSFDYSNGSQTYAGDYTVSWTFTPTDTTNYNTASGSFTASIGKKTPSITVSAVNHEYTNEKYYSYVTASDAKGTLYWKKGSVPTTSSYGGTVDINSVGSSLGTSFPTTYVQYNSDDCTLYWIFVPSSSATITTGQTYAANFDSSAGGNVSMTITPATASVTVTITSTSVYNGSAQTLATATSVGTATAQIGYKKGSAATSDSEITWVNVGTALTATDAGTYYIYKKWTHDANHSNDQTYTAAATTNTRTISQRAVTITAGSKTETYSGTALTYNYATAATASGNTGLVSGHQMTSVTVSGSQTYVGSSNNVPSAATIKDGSNNTVTSNYNITYANGTLTITKATPTVTVTGITADYTGGSFYATAKANAIGTLYWKKGSAPGTTSGTYDGSVKLSTLNTATNVTYVKDNADDFDMYWLFVPSSTDNITTGQTYAANFNNAGGGSSDKVNLTINPRSIANITASATTKVYNGSSQTVSVGSGITVSDSGGNLTSSDYTVSGNTQTNAGSYTITFTGKNNYTGTKTITWTINKRAVTITAGSTSKTYDGTPLTYDSASASAQSGDTGMISSHHIHSRTVSGSQTLAGSSANTVSNAKIYDGTTHGGSGDTTDVTGNYNITYAPGSLTVNKRSVTYKATNQSKVYNGSVLTATNTAEKTGGSNMTDGSLSSHTVTFTCTGEIGPGVSTGTKTLSGVVIKNSGGTDVTSSFTITKQNGTLEITNASITYTNTTPVSEYCTATATATNKTLGNVTISVASASATDYAGNAITNGSDPSVEGYTISQSGWSISSDGKTITIPANVNAGTYNITVTAAKPNHTSKTNGIAVTLTGVSLTGITLELNANSVAYGSSTTVKKVTATYNNAATKDVKDSATYTATKDTAGDDIVSITTTT